MINKYLKSLLAENKRVIIPDFGGFVVKRSATGDIISFNSFLKFNDDLLLNAIVESEGVDAPHALKKIKDAVNVINTSLNEAGKYEIEEVGFLVKDKKGNIRFVAQIDDVAAAVLPSENEAEEPESLVEEREAVVTATSVSDNNKDNPLENDSVDSRTDLDDDGLSGEVSEKMRKGALWIILVVIVIAIGTWAISKYVMNKQYSDSVTKTEIVTGQESTANLTSQLEEEHQQLVETEVNDKTNEVVVEDKKGVLKKIIDFIKSLFTRKGKHEVLVVEAKTKIENLKKEAPVMQAYQVDTISGILVVADRDISPKGEERYNVIIGAFSESDNAMKLNKRLVDDGYASEIFDRYNGFEAVSVGSYPSLDIALKVCGENLNRIPDIWILVR